MDFDKKAVKGIGLFAVGVAFGTAGIRILASRDATKVYTNCAAAALRAKDLVMKTVTKVQENAEDVMAEAKQINEDRAAQEEASIHGEALDKEQSVSEEV